MRINNRDIISIGITGTIGSGKSTVGKILEELGIPVIDTDKIVHELLAKDVDVISEIKREFPSVIIKNEKDNELVDRKSLGKIIFADQKAKTELERILHPQVRKVCEEKISNLVKSKDDLKVVATLIPLLFESERRPFYDQVWTVYCDEKVLRQRLTERDNFSRQEIDLRLAGQLPQKEKCRLADRVLDNSGDENDLYEQILKNLENLGWSSPDLNVNLKG